MDKKPGQKCFVIMPFSETLKEHTEEYWNKHYNQFLKPLIESYPLIAERSSPLRGDILRQIITELITAPIVVADLTDSNPNVYWELGVRQSFKHCTITIAEYGTVLPFDIGVKGTLYYYPNNHIKMQEFTNQFKLAIKDCLYNPTFPDSHVLETIGGRGTLFQILTKQESLRRMDAISDEIDHNLEVIKDVKYRCGKNAKLRKENKSVDCNVTTARNRVISVEALIVNRYIDADSKFYSTAENYYGCCTGFNEQLSAWDLLFEVESAITEKWLSSQCTSLRKDAIDFKNLVKQEKEKLLFSI